MKQVSVVVTYYNLGIEALDALITSLEENESIGEVIIVDDASDSTIHKQYHCKFPVIILRNDTNIGLNPSRMVGAEFASCPFVVFHDGDDYSAPGRIDYQVSYMRKKQLDICFCGGALYSGSPSRDKLKSRSGNVLVEQFFFPLFLLSLFRPYGSTMMWDRDQLMTISRNLLGRNSEYPYYLHFIINGLKVGFFSGEWLIKVDRPAALGKDFSRRSASIDLMVSFLLKNRENGRKIMKRHKCVGFLYFLFRTPFELKGPLLMRSPFAADIIRSYFKLLVTLLSVRS